jgi:NADH-quinone oxidoreductase subunit M
MEKYLIMNPLDFPILSTIIFLPLLGIALILFMRGEGAVKVTALITSIATLFMSLVLYAHFDPQTPLF